MNLNVSVMPWTRASGMGHRDLPSLQEHGGFQVAPHHLKTGGDYEPRARTDISLLYEDLPHPCLFVYLR